MTRPLQLRDLGPRVSVAAIARAWGIAPAKVRRLFGVRVKAQARGGKRRAA